eukprot:9113011-Lingulodinium_polyedra.AAC.1
MAKPVLALPAFSVSAVGMLFLLGRWTQTLKGEGQKNAEKTLKAVLQEHCTLETAMVWSWTKNIEAEHCWPQSSSPDSIAVQLVRGK